ncbi:MAG: hypothetical protein AB1938_04790 [Myxococcota bacterium]
MSLIHWLVSKLPRKLAEDMERESRAWKFICPTCDLRTSVWEMGGVRYKAASRGKRTFARCPRCNAFKWHRVEKDST